MRAGFVYGVRNPYFPDLLKVGMTTNQINQRLGTLSGSSVPGRYELMFLLPVKPVFEAEAAAHKALAAHREDPGKEFFRIEWQTAKGLLETLFDARGYTALESDILPKPPKPREYRDYGGCPWPIRYFREVCEEAGKLRDGAVVTLETALYDAGVFSAAHTMVFAMTEETLNGRITETVVLPPSQTFRFIRVHPELLHAGREEDRVEEVTSGVWRAPYLQATPERALCDYVKVRDRSAEIRKLRGGYNTNLHSTIDLSGLDQDRLWRLAEAMKMTDLLKTWIDNLPTTDLFPERFEHIWNPRKKGSSQLESDDLPASSPSPRF